MSPIDSDIYFPNGAEAHSTAISSTYGQEPDKSSVSTTNADVTKTVVSITQETRDPAGNIVTPGEVTAEIVTPAKFVTTSQGPGFEVKNQVSPEIRQPIFSATLDKDGQTVRHDDSHVRVEAKLKP